MTFQEKFPGLKPGWTNKTTNADGSVRQELHFYLEQDVDKHCLPKERVKKAIEKLRAKMEYCCGAGEYCFGDDNYDPTEKSKSIHNEEFEQIIKELGL